MLRLGAPSPNFDIGDGAVLARGGLQLARLKVSACSGCFWAWGWNLLQIHIKARRHISRVRFAIGRFVDGRLGARHDCGVFARPDRWRHSPPVDSRTSRAPCNTSFAAGPRRISLMLSCLGLVLHSVAAICLHRASSLRTIRSVS